MIGNSDMYRIITIAILATLERVLGIRLGHAACDHVVIANRFDLLDAYLLTKVVKPGKNPIKHFYYVLGPKRSERGVNPTMSAKRILQSDTESAMSRSSAFIRSSD